MIAKAEACIDAAARRTKPLLEFLTYTLHRYPCIIAVGTLFGLSAPWLYRNYQEFLAIGPGGLPYNVRGWLTALVFKLFSRDTLSTAGYDADPNKDRFIADPDSVPERRGTRPSSGFHVLPARQFDKVPPEEMGVRLQEISDRLVKMNPTLVEYGMSPNERRHDGVLIHRSIPTPHKAAKGAQREIFHVHSSDHSMHVLLAPQDAKLVIERNWGERHGLSGAVALGLPREYTWVYAPRNQEELDVCEKIMIAGIKFMTDAQVVNH